MESFFGVGGVNLDRLFVSSSNFDQSCEPIQRANTQRPGFGWYDEKKFIIQTK
jgi:hypothetical protein